MFSVVVISVLIQSFHSLQEDPLDHSSRLLAQTSAQIGFKFVPHWSWLRYFQRLEHSFRFFDPSVQAYARCRACERAQGRQPHSKPGHRHSGYHGPAMACHLYILRRALATGRCRCGPGPGDPLGFAHAITAIILYLIDLLVQSTTAYAYHTGLCSNPWHIPRICSTL